MEAYIKQWADDLKAQRKVTIQPQPVADPETPLTQTNFPSGISTSISFKLNSRAPLIISFLPFPLR